MTITAWRKAMKSEVRDYIIQVSDERRELFLKLQSLIYNLYPKAEAKISYKIVKYVLPSGWVFLGYWKQGVSLYTGYITELPVFAAKHPQIKTGKGSIKLKMTDDIPWEDIIVIIKNCFGR
jgi:uncharacterized protein YdhG (YjbR/CyaY superfamily)